MKNDFWDYVFFTIIGLFILCLVLFLVDCSTGHSIQENGIVFERVFSPGKTGTGVGPNLSGNGGIAVVVTSTSDEWHVLVKTKTDIYDTEVSKKQWVYLKIGETVIVEHWIGGISKSNFNSEIKFK